MSEQVKQKKEKAKKVFAVKKFTDGIDTVSAVQLTQEFFNEAIEFLGGNATVKYDQYTVIIHGVNANSVAKAAGTYKVQNTEQVKNATGRTVIRQKEELDVIDYEGDFIVSDDKGNFKAISAEDFNKNFEEVK